MACDVCWKAKKSCGNGGKSFGWSLQCSTEINHNYRSSSRSGVPHQGRTQVAHPENNEVMQSVLRCQRHFNWRGGGSQWRPNLHQPAPWQASVNGRQIIKIRRCCDSEDHKEVHSEHKGITEGGHGGDVSKAWARACSGSKNLWWNGLPDGVSVLVGFFRTVVIIMSFARNRTSPRLLVWNIIHLHDLLYCE